MAKEARLQRLETHVQTKGAPGLSKIDTWAELLVSVRAPIPGVRYECAPRFEACLSKVMGAADSRE